MRYEYEIMKQIHYIHEKEKLVKAITAAFEHVNYITNIIKQKQLC